MANKEYKSDVFAMLMEDKRNALQVYNAVNGSDYDDPSQIQVVTLEKGISLSLRNDSAFILGNALSLYEHQSTVCPNMPLRFYFYFGEIIETMVQKRDLYGKRMIKIPTPHFVVFYNGLEEQPAKQKYRLSNAFLEECENPEIELICTVYNINAGKNSEMMNKCPVLRDYMKFVDYVRDYEDNFSYRDLEDVILAAIEKCISEGILEEFFREHRAEVAKVTQLDYTFERREILIAEEAKEEGREEGREEGKMEMLISLVKDGLISVSDAALKAGMDEQQFKKMM